MLLCSKSQYCSELAFSATVPANLHCINKLQAVGLCLPRIYACVFPLHTLNFCRAFLKKKDMHEISWIF